MTKSSSLISDNTASERPSHLLHQMDHGPALSSPLQLVLPYLCSHQRFVIKNELKIIALKKIKNLSCVLNISDKVQTP